MLVSTPSNQPVSHSSSLCTFLFSSALRKVAKGKRSAFARKVYPLDTREFIKCFFRFSYFCNSVQEQPFGSFFAPPAVLQAVRTHQCWPFFPIQLLMCLPGSLGPHPLPVSTAYKRNPPCTFVCPAPEKGPGMICATSLVATLARSAIGSLIHSNDAPRSIQMALGCFVIPVPKAIPSVRT